MIKRVALLAAALLLAAAPALCQAEEAPDQGMGMDQGMDAQRQLPPGHPPVEGRGGPAPPVHWNPQTVQEFEGKITAMGPAVSPVPGQRVEPPGALMIALETKEGPQEVLLGPSWYLYQQEPRLKLGDEVKVTGSVITQAGRRYVLAQSVVKDGQTLTLRDERGFPMWAGGRYGRGAGRQMGPSRCPMGGRGAMMPGGPTGSQGSQ